jgi:hypothetical protein
MEVVMKNFLSRSSNRLAVAAAAVVVVFAAAGGGYYYLSSEHGTAAKHSGQSVSLAEIGICKAVVARARDYGVLPPDAAKVGERAADEKNPDRVTCSAQANDGTFKLTADVHCDDANADSCLELQKVTNDSGTALYDTHEI